MELIEAANSEALTRMLAADLVRIDVIPAKDAIPELDKLVILHAGPPIDWDRMCGPMRGAVAGIAVFEGWAEDLLSAENMAVSNEFKFFPNHHFDAVGPMTGMTTCSQPVLIVENKTFGNRAYCTINEGLGKVMRFGGNDKEVLNRLHWLKDVFGPSLGAAIREIGGIPLKNIVARGLTMGDGMHQRNVARSGLMLRALGPALARTMGDAQQLAECLSFIGGNDPAFLNIAMAIGKAMMDPVSDIEGCSIPAHCRHN
jgi:hypothetical protein